MPFLTFDTGISLRNLHTFEKASMVCSLNCLPSPKSPILRAPLAPTKTFYSVGCKGRIDNSTPRMSAHTHAE